MVKLPPSRQKADQHPRPNGLAGAGELTRNGLSSSPPKAGPLSVQSRREAADGAQPRLHARGHQQPPGHGEGDPRRIVVFRPSDQGIRSVADVRTGNRIRPRRVPLAAPAENRGRPHVFPEVGRGTGGPTAARG